MKKTIPAITLACLTALVVRCAERTVSLAVEEGVRDEGQAGDAGGSVDSGVADAGGQSMRPLFDGPDWYRRTVFYEIWVRSYFDADGDGIGDLRGITAKLDYIKSLGVGAIWLSPIHPTPYFDSGYDVADYRAVNPQYGTLGDLDELVREVHARGMRLFLDLVLNHTSIEHPWFVESRSSTDNPKRAWYQWAKEPDIPCKPDAQFGDSGWTLDDRTGEYYFHHFYPQQPDLNYRNPEVAAEMLATMGFWLDRGVDGFRVDAIDELYEDEPTDTPSPGFVCVDHPLTFQFAKKMRAVLDRYDRRAMVAEAWASPQVTAAYYGDGSDGFPMSFSQEMAAAIQPALMFRTLGGIPQAIRDTLAPLPPGAQVANWLSNHDQPRTMARVDNDVRRAAAAAVLLLTLPGTPFVYYGDEVGVRNGAGVVVDSRDGSRTPMQWIAGRNVGFTTGTPWLPPAPGAEGANVADEENNPGSLLNLHRKLIDVRNRLDLFGTGTFELVRAAGTDDSVLVYVVRDGPRAALVALSFSSRGQVVPIDLSSIVTAPASVEIALAPPAPLTPAAAASYTLTLKPYGYVVWSVK